MSSNYELPHTVDDKIAKSGNSKFKIKKSKDI